VVKKSQQAIDREKAAVSAKPNNIEPQKGKIDITGSTASNVDNGLFANAQISDAARKVLSTKEESEN
jgi:hypothetical protein